MIAGGEEEAGWHGAGEDHFPEGHAAAEQPSRLALHEEDRLPWLESGEDFEEYETVDMRRVATAVIGGLVVLAAVVGGIWWGTHRKDVAVGTPDGSTIAAPATPYKEAPKNAGGKTYAGTGDSSYEVSQGQSPAARLADNGDGNGGDAGNAAASAAAAASSASLAAHGGAGMAPAGGDHGPAMPAASHSAQPVASASPVHPAPGHPAPVHSAAPVSAPDTAVAGGLAQVGAYSTQALAEAAWSRLSTQVDALKGERHRVVQGQADIGTVWRLQVITSAGGGGALCARLKAAGLACQVKK